MTKTKQTFDITNYSDAEQVKTLLLWCRRERIAVGQIAVGTVSLVVADLGLGADSKPEKPEPRQSIYEKYGGDVFVETQKAQEEDLETIEDDD